MTISTRNKALRPLLMLGLTLALVGPTLLVVVWATPPGSTGKLVGTSLLYPPPTRTLRFSHKKHPPGDFECTQCHTKVKTSTSAGDNLRPSKKACLDCHDEAKVPKGFGKAGKTNNKACKKCHTKFNLKGFPVAARWPKSRVRFTHQIHIQKKIACKKCHAGVAKSGYGGKRHLPSMALCLGCHNGKAKSPPSKCTTCHERTAGGRMRVSYPEGKLKPGPSLPDLQHGPTFGKQHKTAARARKGACYQCHQKATCLRCHGGIRKPASIHLGNYILRHGADARSKRLRCKSCHTKQSFCRSCHKRTGVARSNKKSPYRVPGIRKFHGNNWSSSTSRGSAFNRHATHARRNVGVCVSCHTEKDCMRCHARRRVGGLGRSPHGPGFRHSRRCKILLKKNRRACLKCHGFRDPLMGLCR